MAVTLTAIEDAAVTVDANEKVGVFGNTPEFCNRVHCQD